ncbi:MAG: hypothetical protein C4527_29475 [Candidatus Omnitrophota bacterium]|nr:MAG: hypothetical protein C4527_29475 [Candidatus Omnitrophota bacterium]
MIEHSSNFTLLYMNFVQEIIHLPGSIPMKKCLSFKRDDKVGKTKNTDFQINFLQIQNNHPMQLVLL